MEGGEDRQPTMIGQKVTKSVTASCHKILNLCVSWGYVEVYAYLNAPKSFGCRPGWFQSQPGHCALTGIGTVLLVTQLERGDRVIAW